MFSDQRAQNELLRNQSAQRDSFKDANATVEKELNELKKHHQQLLHDLALEKEALKAAQKSNADKELQNKKLTELVNKLEQSRYTDCCDSHNRTEMMNAQAQVEEDKHLAEELVLNAKCT